MESLGFAYTDPFRPTVHRPDDRKPSQPTSRKVIAAENIRIRIRRLRSPGSGQMRTTNKKQEGHRPQAALRSPRKDHVRLGRLRNWECHASSVEHEGFVIPVTSSVVMGALPTLPTGFTHERITCEPMIGVHAPHCAIPHPKRGPFKAGDEIHNAILQPRWAADEESVIRASKAYGSHQHPSL